MKKIKAMAVFTALVLAVSIGHAQTATTAKPAQKAPASTQKAPASTQKAPAAKTQAAPAAKTNDATTTTSSTATAPSSKHKASSTHPAHKRGTSATAKPAKVQMNQFARSHEHSNSLLQKGKHKKGSHKKAAKKSPSGDGTGN